MNSQTHWLGFIGAGKLAGSVIRVAAVEAATKHGEEMAQENI